MEVALERLVWERARNCCEYCRMPQEYDEITFEIDHIIPKKHGGPTAAENLALACFYCNNRKGPNLSGIDPETGKVTELFNPRRQRWARHFRWEAPRVVGRTRSGRATVATFVMNLPARVELREVLIENGLFPPD
jgi:hypothetical protein